MRSACVWLGLWLTCRSERTGCIRGSKGLSAFLGALALLLLIPRFLCFYLSKRKLSWGTYLKNYFKIKLNLAISFVCDATYNIQL